MSVTLRARAPASPRARSANAGNETQGIKAKISDRAPGVRRGERCRERVDDAQAGVDVRDSQAARQRRGADHRRGRRRDFAGRICFPALRRRQLSSRSRRYLCLAVADQAAGVADRRYGRRGDPEPQGRRALFRAAQMQRDQFRGPGKDPAQGPLRQFDAALSRRTVTARGRRPDPQGYVGAGHRYRRAHRQGAAGAHRRAAAHRQDGAACRTSPSRSPPITRNAI